MAEERVNDLDGMRGLATVLVVSYHVFKRGDYFTTNGVLHFITSLTLYGWYALDTFFVLSGFLITGILLRTKGEQHFYRNFYVRRSLRVFPLYYFTLIVILSLMPLLDSEYVAQIPGILPYLLFYQQNWLYFWGNLHLTIFLSVTWSLAIEEQFYLLWPVVANILRKEALVKLCVSIISVSILARIIGVAFFADVPKLKFFFYYNTFTRMEEIAFGALLAIAFTYPEWKSKLSKIAYPVFLVTYPALLILEVVTNTGTPHPAYNMTLTLVGYTLAAVFAAALITTLTTRSKTSVIRRIFRNKVLVFIGDHSYSIYLFHAPVCLVLLDLLWRNGFRGWYIMIIYIALSFGITVIISLLTYRFVEKPALDLKRYFEYKEA